MKDKGCILVCVTSQPDCERLIRAGHTMARERNLPLKVCSVLPQSSAVKPQPEVLENLYRKASDCGAEMTIYFNDSPAVTAAVYALKVNAQSMVVGFPKENGSPFVQNVRLLAPKILINMVDADGKIYQLHPEITNRERKKQNT